MSTESYPCPRDGNISIILMARCGHLPAVIHLIEEGVNSNLDDALSGAAWMGHLHVVRYLTSILREKSPAAIDDALISASGEGDLNIAVYLLSQGADVHAKGNRALKVALREEHPILAELLLDMTTKLPDKLSKKLVNAINIDRMWESAISKGIKGAGSLSKLIAKYY